MLKANNYFALLDFDAAGQAIFFRILVPLIQHVEFLVGRRIEIFHARRDCNGASSAGAIKTSRLHLDSRLFPRIEKKGAGGNFGGLTAG